ncbi:MAG TPA: deoxyhypusine synthase family protein [Nitrososphaerales archaeon]
MKMDEVVDVEPNSDVASLAKAMSRSGFGGRSLGEAVEIFREMVLDKNCIKFLGVSGALVPCGLRKIISRMISEKYVDFIVSTGANITHDLSLAFGGKQYQLKGKDSKLTDVELRRKGFFRVYDVCIPSADFTTLERNLTGILQKLPEGVYGSSELLSKIGCDIKDVNSIVKNASDAGVPIVIPAFTDSIMGLQVWSIIQTLKLKVDVFKDLALIVNKQFDIRSERKSSGAVFLGGGVPKNFILQSALTADKPFDYFIQIVTDRPEFGGLSGATPDEAKSWGKVRGSANGCTVNCDASIAMPFIMSAVFNS